jgi:hypothetical protein
VDQELEPPSAANQRLIEANERIKRANTKLLGDSLAELIP